MSELRTSRQVAEPRPFTHALLQLEGASGGDRDQRGGVGVARHGREKGGENEDEEEEDEEEEEEEPESEPESEPEELELDSESESELSPPQNLDACVGWMTGNAC